MRGEAYIDDMVDLCGRIMLTHHIKPEHAMRVLRIDRDNAVDMIAQGCTTTRLDEAAQERLRLFVNILHRLEHRLRHDGAAIRIALETPLDALEGKAPAELLGGDIAALHAVRKAIDEIQAPKVKWFRIGH
ncbi:MAG TPA: hypothetical protein VFT56_06265 [Sphingomonas sp.]|nr:hypothetical protein [Sphingomonas sp.]